MEETVKEFVRDTYRLISANSPTVPLHGDDLKIALRTLNQLLRSYVAGGKYLSVTKTTTFTMPQGQQEVTYGPADVAADVQEGRIAKLFSVWVVLNNIDYPLKIFDDQRYFDSFKYEPLTGLPRFAIILDGKDSTTLRIYPAPSQNYTLHARGIYSVESLKSTDSVDNIPIYSYRFVQLALAKYLSLKKGRASAWTTELQDEYEDARLDILNNSERGLTIVGSNETLLNGANRVKAGV